MPITVEIPPHIENRIRANIVLGHVNTARILLEEAFTPALEALMHDEHDETFSHLSDEEFEALSDQLADELLAYGDPDRYPLSDDAVSREGFYDIRL
ncbi:hypothetical protein QUF80_21800 [Desulfococcaceae bacterium HSG8]|nr:hypothetical protein [Desulfococcaceae bacterium HSG8]